MAALPGTVPVVTDACPHCPWPVHLNLPVSWRGAKGTHPVAVLDEDALHQAARAHLAQHGVTDDED